MIIRHGSIGVLGRGVRDEIVVRRGSESHPRLTVFADIPGVGEGAEPIFQLRFIEGLWK
jgi:hypothetical protein